MVISSRQNGKIKRVASLKEKKYRALYGEYIVEGVKMVTEAIKAEMPIKEIYGVSSVLSLLPPCNAPIIETDESVFSCISETKSPQGVLAVLAIPQNKAEKPSGNCAVLDGISDPGNLGTIIRTSAALGIKDIYLCDCADAFAPKVIRSSMSGIFFVNLHFFNRETVADLVKENTLVVADMGGENLFSFKAEGNYALLIGNEANGVSDFFMEKANTVVSIPMDEKVESLNAAVSFAVIAYTLSANKKI